MAEIQNFAVSDLKLAQHCNFHKSVNKLIEKYTPAVLHIEQLAPVYTSIIGDEDDNGGSLVG